MPGLLYLDTARVGQISPAAHRALTDYFRLNAEQRWPLYFDEFFRESATLSDSILSEYDGLNCWKGFSHLRSQIRRLLEADAKSEIWFSSRSAKLMEFASKLMFRRCRNVLITDLTWPSYESILRSSIPNSSCKITKVAIADRIHAGNSPGDLIGFLSDTFLNNRCEGLFLPLVSHLGIRLPVKQVVQEVRTRTKLRFVCVDIAQAVNHLPIEADSRYFDFAIGGTHKWLRSFLPLGFAVSGNPRTRDFIAESAIRWTESYLIDDPLFEFANRGDTDKFGETINASPFLACAGAVEDAKTQLINENDDHNRETVREQIIDILSRSGLRVRETRPEFWSNIVTFADAPSSKSSKVAQVHRRLKILGIATSFVSNLLRISLPPAGLSQSQLHHLEAVNHT